MHDLSKQEQKDLDMYNLWVTAKKVMDNHKDDLEPEVRQYIGCLIEALD